MRQLSTIAGTDTFWQLLAQRTGAKLAYLPVTGDEALLDLAKLDSLLTKQVKLFAMVHVSNSMGTVNPVADLCARARKLGIATLVDGAQSAGHMPVDVQAIGCDFFTFSGHKICGQPASASCGGGRNCSTPCPRIKAAAR